jgi:hypothetical protein
VSEDREAKIDYALLHIALARRKLGLTVDLSAYDGDDDEPATLFALDELDDAVGRHPANGPQDAA